MPDLFFIIFFYYLFYKILIVYGYLDYIVI